MDDDDEPTAPLKAIAESEITIFGKRLRCYVLEDHSRVINAEDVEAFFSELGDGPIIDHAEAERQMKRFQDFMSGKS